MFNHTLQVTDRDDSLLINKRFSVILSKAHLFLFAGLLVKFVVVVHLWPLLKVSNRSLATYDVVWNSFTTHD